MVLPLFSWFHSLDKMFWHVPGFPEGSWARQFSPIVWYRVLDLQLKYLLSPPSLFSDCPSPWSKNAISMPVMHCPVLLLHHIQTIQALPPAQCLAKVGWNCVRVVDRKLSEMLEMLLPLLVGWIIINLSRFCFVRSLLDPELLWSYLLHWRSKIFFICV